MFRLVLKEFVKRLYKELLLLVLLVGIAVVMYNWVSFLLLLGLAFVLCWKSTKEQVEKKEEDIEKVITNKIW